MANLKQPKTDSELKGMKIASLRDEYLNLADDYNSIIDNKVIYCPKCGKWLSSSNFYMNKNNADNIEHWGCKKCIIQAGTDYNKRTGEYKDNKEKAKHILMLLDLPFIEKTYDDQVQSMIDGLNEKNRSTGFQQYFVMISSLPQYRNLKWENSEFIDTDDAVSNNSKRKPRREVIKIFGSGYSNEDYLYLQDQYDEWKARTQVDSKSQETYIIEICCQLLDIRKARQAGKDVNKLTDALSKLMGDANLQPKQNVNNAATDSLTFGQLIEKWELEDPIPEPDEEFKDVNKIGQLVDIFFKGHLAKMMGLKNGLSAQYDDFMKKYTVTKPEYEDEEGSEAIFNSLFGKEIE